MPELYWQAWYHRTQIPKCQHLIWCTDSKIEDQEYKKLFGELAAKHSRYTRYADIYVMPKSMMAETSQWATIDRQSWTNDLDFFCLVGRADAFRKVFTDRLCELANPRSLVCYQGKDLWNPQHVTDANRYSQSEFFSQGVNEYLDMTFGSAYLQPTMYNRFAYEVVVETTAWYGDWPTQELTVTEKSFKPMLAGKPALVFGAVGFNHYWKTTFGIDLGMKNFDMSWDLIPDDQSRLDAFLNVIANTDATKVRYNRKQHLRNLSGVQLMLESNRAEMRNLARQVLDLAS